MWDLLVLRLRTWPILRTCPPFQNPWVATDRWSAIISCHTPWHNWGLVVSSVLMILCRYLLLKAVGSFQSQPEQQCWGGIRPPAFISETRNRQEVLSFRSSALVKPHLEDMPAKIFFKMERRRTTPMSEATEQLLMSFPKKGSDTVRRLTATTNKLRTIFFAKITRSVESTGTPSTCMGNL